ncbi:hypothetical protein Tco_0616022 [Tanacetum coccineum]
MDNPNLTMEEYIRLEEEKARKRGKVFNWQTATYGKIRVDDDFYDLRSMEAEFPAIVVNDDFAPKDTLQCKSQVSIPVNDEIDFRISFDESDDEDYTIICDKNSFSYKMISVNNLKTDSENDYEKVMPSIPSPEPAISCFDDLDFFKDFENEFPAIVYNDAQTSKSDLLTELIFNPQHINEFDLSDETSLSEYDEEEQNILYEGLEYTDSNIADFESRMVMEHRDEASVVVFTCQAWDDSKETFLKDKENHHSDIGWGTDVPVERMVMEHHDEAGVVVFTSQAPENVSVTNLFYLRGLDVGSVNIPYLLA